MSGVGPLSKGTGHMTVLISMGSVRSGLKQSEFSLQSEIDLSRKRNIYVRMKRNDENKDALKT